MKPTLPLLITTVLLGCDNGQTDATGDQAPLDSLAVSGTAPALDLSPQDLPLQIVLPDLQATGGVAPQLGWHEEEGWFFVNAGDRFSLHITEEPGDIARLKGDLERDLLRKHTIITDMPDLLVYRSEFPDDPDLVFVHFYQMIIASDRSFVVESDPEGKFTEADVERMRMAVSPKAPA